MAAEDTHGPLFGLPVRADHKRQRLLWVSTLAVRVRGWAKALERSLTCPEARWFGPLCLSFYYFYSWVPNGRLSRM